MENNYDTTFIGIPSSNSSLARITAIQRLSNDSEKKEEELLPKNLQKTLELYEKLISQENKKEEVDFFDLFTAIYCAYNLKNCPYFMLADNKSLFKIAENIDPDRAPLIDGIISMFEKKGLISYVSKLPYGYKGVNSDEVRNCKRKLYEDSEENLIEYVDKLHGYLQLVFPTEEGRVFFFNLYRLNKQALYNAINTSTQTYAFVHTLKKQINEVKELKDLLDECWKGFKECANYLQKRKNALKSKEEASNIVKADLAKINENAQEVAYIPSEKFNNLYSRQAYDMLRHFLLVVLRHNARIYDSDSELEKHFKSSCFSYETLLDSQVSTLLTHCDLTMIRKMLDLLTSAKRYDTSFPIYDVLLLSSPDIIQKINELLFDNRVSIEFVQKNPSIFVEKISEETKELTNIKEGTYASFIENTNRLRASKIDTANLSRKRESSILLGDPKDIQATLDLIGLYGLNYTNSDDYSLFSNRKLIRIADRFIEHGWGEFIRINSSFINESTEKYLKRMDFCKQFGISFEKKGKLPSMVITPQFEVAGNLISDSDLNDYILNATSYFESAVAFDAIESSPVIIPAKQEIKELEKFSSGKFAYRIGNVLIAKPKALRNLAIIESSDICSGLSREEKIFNAIIHGSILTDEELTQISRLLNEEIKKLEKQ